jgi:hypothetical protein
MANKHKRALQRSQHRPASSSARMPEVQPRGRCVPPDTQRVELKSRTFEEIGSHFQRSSKAVEWKTDEPDVD